MGRFFTACEKSFFLSILRLNRLAKIHACFLNTFLFMSTLYGLWIDHSHAFLMKANDEDVVNSERIDSKVEPHHHGGVTQEHLSITNQNKDDARRHNQMQQFCKCLVERLKDADEIAIFGPGNAKFELKNFLEKSPALHRKLIAVETSDKLTENQMKAYTRQLFQLPRET